MEQIQHTCSGLAKLNCTYMQVIGQCRKSAAHSSTFGFLPTHKAQTKKPKELEFSQRTDKEIKNKSYF